jgi:3-oxoacyl-[acyl-carrier-protein] synthase-1
MIFFAERALRGCLADLPKNAFSNLPVFLALPEPSRGAPLVIGQLADAVVLAIRDVVPSSKVAGTYEIGRAAFFQALGAAAAAIAQQTAEAAIIVGMDSYCDKASLEQLGNANRILGDSNPDGLIPGEGAGAVLVTTAVAARRAGLEPLASLETYAFARDAEPFEERTGAHAHALTTVLRQLHGAQPSAPRVDAVFSCQTQEGLWARELSIAHLRNPPLMPEPQRRRMLADTLGDTGAAAGPIQLGMLVHLSPRGWRRNRKLDRAILYGAADCGDVGACIVATSRPTASSTPYI